MSDVKATKIKAEVIEHPITEPIRRRLPAYYRALITMYAAGEEKVSSKQLASVISLAESQVRTDMLAIGCKGQKGYGYNIARLYKRIGEVMRVRDTYSAIIVGGGAAADYVATSELFTKRGIKLLGCFSEKDAKAEVDERSALERFCAEKAVDIFILTCSGEAAAHCLAVAESLGIQGVLNLSSLDLSSDKLIVRNIHIEDALMMLCSEL